MFNGTLRENLGILVATAHNNNGIRPRYKEWRFSGGGSWQDENEVIVSGRETREISLPANLISPRGYFSVVRTRHRIFVHWDVPKKKLANKSPEQNNKNVSHGTVIIEKSSNKSMKQAYNRPHHVRYKRKLYSSP